MSPVLSLALAFSAATSGPVALDKLISFKKAPQCIASEQFGNFLDGLVRYDANDRPNMGVVRAPKGMAGAFGKLTSRRMKEWVEIELPVKGTWRGIPVVQLSLAPPNGGDPPGWVIGFKTSLRTLTQAARKAGLPPSGTVHDDQVYVTTFTIGKHPNQPDIVELRCEIGE